MIGKKKGKVKWRWTSWILLLWKLMSWTLNARKCISIACQWDPFAIFIISSKKSTFISVFSLVFSLCIIIYCIQPRAKCPHSIYWYDTKGRTTHKNIDLLECISRLSAFWNKSQGWNSGLIYIPDYYFNETVIACYFLFSGAIQIY